MTPSERVAIWRKANPEKTKKQRDDYRARHRTRLSEEQKARFRSDWDRRKITAIRSRCKSSGIEFTIDVQYLKGLNHPKICPILGIDVLYDSSGRSAGRASLDRIDPRKGYIPGNVWIISYRANAIKNDGTIEEHKAIVRVLESLNA